MISNTIWGVFIALVIAMMAVDLGLFNKKDHIPSAKEALRNTIIWVFAAALFGVFIYFGYEYNWQNLGLYEFEPMDGAGALLKYFTGYLLEEALSIDNLFVIALIFSRFKIPKMYQHKVLFWGIIGVLIFRGILIGVGTTLVHHFTSLFYFFGVFLLYSAYKLLRHQDEDPEGNDIDKNKVVRFIRKFYPVSTHGSHGHFFTVEQGKKAMTPLLVALIVVEITDVMFAFDSVPAVLSITTDPFLVFSSNIFAILGLRSLYFVLSDFMDRFAHLRYSLIAILSFIGLKMILIPLHVHMPVWVSLSVIAFLLLAGVFTSLQASRSEKKAAE
jgi:tellurite resistance protein TerC